MGTLFGAARWLVSKQRGAEVVFLCRRQLGDLIALLENEFRVLVLPEQPLSLCDGLGGRELYEVGSVAVRPKMLRTA